MNSKIETLLHQALRSAGSKMVVASDGFSGIYRFPTSS